MSSVFSDTENELKQQKKFQLYFSFLIHLIVIFMPEQRGYNENGL